MLQEIVELLRLYSQRFFEGKKGLLEVLAQEFQLKIPSSYSYPRIVEAIIKQGKESEFCQKLFGTKNFEEAILRHEITNGLLLFSRDELIKIADDVSDKQTKWSYDKSSKESLIGSIVEKVTKDQMAQCLEKLIRDKSLPAIRQYGGWSAGPLGIMRSMSRRTALASDDWTKFLMKYIDYDIYLALVELANLPKEVIFERNDPLLHEKSIQVILAFADDETLTKSVNQLIDDGRIHVRSVEEYWDFFATPCGIFEKAYRGVEALADLLMKEFSEAELDSELSREGCVSGSFEMRVLEKCVKENPSKILSDLFGFPMLKRIARNLGLIAVDKIKDRSELINIILLKLGFETPPRLVGISAYQETLENYKRQLESAELQPEQKIGMMTSVYVETERILKDIIYFYIANLWREKIAETREMKEAADKTIREEFKVEKRVDILTFGDMISLLRKMNERAGSEEQLKERVLEDFKRPHIVLKQHMQTLDQISPYRSSFTHDKKTVEVDLKTCTEIVSKLIALSRDLEEKRIYPYLIRVAKEVTNEYGVTYLEAIDEKGGKWILKPKGWVKPGPVYFMFSETNPIAVHPIVTAKFW